MKFSPSRAWSRHAFTLVELMVATVVLLIILVMLVTMVNQTAAIWRNSAIKVEQFRSARSAFESINRRLSQATLNTYFDYSYDKDKVPIKYVRQSDLRFIVGSARKVVPESKGERAAKAGLGHAVFFHAPLGYVSSDREVLTDKDNQLYGQMDNLMNTWGYYTEFGSDYNYRPPFLNVTGGGGRVPPERYRYRLMEFMVPSDQMITYRYTSRFDNSTYIGSDWFSKFLDLPTTQTLTAGTRTNQLRPTHLLAENVISLIVFPQFSRKDQDSITQAGGPLLAPGYAYNSATQVKPSGPRTDQRNQLPPVVQVTMVAIDESSAVRLAAQEGRDSTNPPQALESAVGSLFTTYDVLDPQGGGASTGPAANYNRDLRQLQAELVKQRLAFRVFTTSISMKAAKWSQD